MLPQELLIRLTVAEDTYQPPRMYLLNTESLDLVPLPVKINMELNQKNIDIPLTMSINMHRINLENK